MATMSAAQVLDELGALEDPKMRAINERHGDDHGVNLSRLRALAKELGRDELDSMLREARAPKVHDWLVKVSTSPDCTSPFAPIWINEMVARRS